MNYMERYDFWCNADLPEDVRIELNGIKNILYALAFAAITSLIN